MKKILSLTITFALLLVMVIGAAGCGGETSTTSTAPSATPSTEPSLADVTTDQGISLKLPSDMTLLENGAYASTDKTEVCTFSVSPADGSPISSVTEESILEGYKSKYENVAMKSFKNDSQINGKDAAIIQLTMTTPAGKDVTMTQAMVTDNTNYYIVSFMYPTGGTDGALAKNLQACIDSITIK